jgi:hypothetical protein
MADTSVVVGLGQIFEWSDQAWHYCEGDRTCQGMVATIDLAAIGLAVCYFYSRTEGNCAAEEDLMGSEGEHDWLSRLVRPIMALIGLLFVTLPVSAWMGQVGAGIIVGVAILRLLDWSGAKVVVRRWAEPQRHVMLTRLGLILFGIGLFTRIEWLGFGALGLLAVVRVDLALVSYDSSLQSPPDG